MYHKTIKIATTLLSLIMVFVLFVQPTRAASSNYTYDFSDLYHCEVNYDPIATASSIDGIYETDSGYVATFDKTIKITFYQSQYTASSLYSSGWFRIAFDLPVNFASSHQNRCHMSYEITNNFNDGVTGYVYKVNWYTGSQAYLRIISYVYLDNFYALKGKTSMMASFDINVHFAHNIGTAPVSADYRIDFGDVAFDNQSYTVKSNFLPDSTYGSAQIIAQSVADGIGQSSLEELLEASNSQLNSANTNLGTVISMLTSIQQQDRLFYQDIVNRIVAQTQNDNDLQRAFIQFLTAQLYGSSSYSSPSGPVQMSGPIGEIASRIWYEVIDFKYKFIEFYNANQSEAAEANSAAESQAQALDNLSQSMVVSTRPVDSVFSEIEALLSPDLLDGQSNAFFWLDNSFILTILIMSVSFGLVGFILYGKG